MVDRRTVRRRLWRRAALLKQYRLLEQTTLLLRGLASHAVQSCSIIEVCSIINPKTKTGTMKFE
jgi:hypothetical protein